ncbi:Zn(II)2Cys6 transcription factor domain-containing protein [Sporobolomyces salmoneus]|uniref:Zn(II)2Cys6 transcription factor domain-containing protein n=1 Tax=Sporobolomyces salmoneus TaxID=183962 RepID=UPI00317D75E6
MQPASGKEKAAKEKAKVGRRRIACIACSSNKQKCDGATRHPCRRCELYSVACEYPDGEVPRSAVRVTSGNRPEPTTSGGGLGAATRSQASSDAGGQPQDIAASETATLLREIKDRLASIENGLENDRRQGVRTITEPTTSNSLSLPTASPRSDPQRPLPPPSATNSDSASHALEQMDMPGESNPLQVLVATLATLDEAERLNRRDSAMEEDRESDERESGTEAGGSRKLSEARTEDITEEEQLLRQARRTTRSNRPDVFSRGLMSTEDVELAFAFYRQRVQPWVPVVEDRSPLLVRSKSPFLFHSILLVTDFYNTSTSPRAAEVYTGLTAIINELVAAIIFAPDPSVFNSDLVRGLLLLLYYKPVQTTFLHHRGLKTNSRISYASKLNALSSYMIHSLLQRTASFLNLQQSPVLLYMYFDNPEAAAKSGAPPYEEVLDDYRLWCSLIAADNLGSLQSGRASWADPTSALRVGRKFATLGGHPTDVRRTAILELYSIIAVPPSAAAATRPVRYRLERLPQINAELERWRAHWKPLLDEAQRKGDPLAYTVERTLASFVSLSVNGATFSRWSLERQKDIDQGKEGRPKLTTDDWTQLQVAADAAQSAIYAVSLEAQDLFKPLRGEEWPRVNGTERETLRMSLAVAEDFKTALDTITCIAFAYSLLFLLRMSSAGLISGNIATRQTEYESGATLGAQPLTSGDKLPLLLELGSNFLHAISPSIDHPAESHAVLIQTILKVGSGSPFSPQLPPPGAGIASATTSAPSVSLESRTQDLASSQTSYLSGPPASVSSFSAPSLRRTHQPDSMTGAWPWDTRKGASSSSFDTDPLKSIAIPNLVDEPPSISPSQPTMPTISTSAFGKNKSHGVDQLNGDEDPAQAMASLLASSNPFLGEFYATQPSLNSSGYNDDFGLTGVPVGDLNSEWTNFGDLGGLTGSSWIGL